MDEILSCRNMTVGYDGVRMCGNIDFTVHSGEYICVVGHSGIGKSALVNTLLGITPPIDGEIQYLNGLVRSDIGCMPQHQDIRGTSLVKDVVLSGCLGRMKGIFVGRHEKEIAAAQLERLHISDLAKRRFGELSGGQRQKVLLARALCAAKKLLILDEPMYGLDAVAKDEMFNEISRLNKEDGIAVIIIDSDALDGTVLHLSDRQLYCGDVSGYIKSVPGQFYFAGRII
ncbi:MAG: ATP-binding cassette domain-containing protein [Ruminococcaceae bacterium]|nr:ATP-binding cassette domain-containing protein [Oscillospiraceae bacterium]